MNKKGKKACKEIDVGEGAWMICKQDRRRQKKGISRQKRLWHEIVWVYSQSHGISNDFRVDYGSLSIFF